MNHFKLFLISVLVFLFVNAGSAFCEINTRDIRCDRVPHPSWQNLYDVLEIDFTYDGKFSEIRELRPNGAEFVAVEASFDPKQLPRVGSFKARDPFTEYYETEWELNITPGIYGGGNGMLTEVRIDKHTHQVFRWTQEYYCFQ